MIAVDNNGQLALPSVKVHANGRYSVEVLLRHEFMQTWTIVVSMEWHSFGYENWWGGDAPIHAWGCIPQKPSPYDT